MNLIRNSKVYFTTNLNTNREVNASGFLPANTWQVEVMNGFSFNQATTTETVTLNEAGASPVRGQRSFNTALDPVEFTMATYMRPAYIEAGASDTITAAEKVLWNAFMGTGALGSGAWTETAGATGGTTTCSFANSNSHQLQAFGLVIVLDTVVYYIDNCALDTATVDFGLDAIAMVTWTGRGTRLRQSETLPTLVSGTNFAPVPATSRFIANKLSTTTVKGGINGTGDTYIVPITGGTLSLSNNLTYLTPEVLGTVNTPVTYFTGTRAVSGELTAYLRSNAATKLTAELQQDVLATSATAQETKFSVKIEVGGITNTHRVEFNMPAVMLQVPTVTTDQVVTTTIGFTAQGSSTGNYDITAANELTVSYFAAA